MPITTALSPTWAYSQPLTWEDVCGDPSLKDLPYRIELDRYGRLLMSPVSNRHSRLQGRIARLLEGALGGEAYPECAIYTAEGVRAPDVVWMSDSFASTIPEGVLALERAPEICVEVRSPSNSWEEMEEKITLYLAKGAKEVWLCDLDGAVTFFSHEGQIEPSRLAPDFPARLDA
jgi:Uma2 family endonuclease